MRITLLIDSRKLCEEIENGSLESAVDILTELRKFEYEYDFPESGSDTLFDLLFQKRRDEGCSFISRQIEKTQVDNRQTVFFDEGRYIHCKEELERLYRKESKSIKKILYNKEYFEFDKFLMEIGDADYIRCISSKEQFCRAAALFLHSEKEVRGFAANMRKVYANIVFDKEIEKSMASLEAGFLARKHEIIYHLYCINQELPRIIRENGCSGNQLIGDMMSVSCSPERSRNVVENKLTKKSDDGKIKIKCELHTKMEKIGGHKPDRIYFCACAPDGAVVNKENISQRIFVYKITEHA